MPTLHGLCDGCGGLHRQHDHLQVCEAMLDAEPPRSPFFLAAVTACVGTQALFLRLALHSPAQAAGSRTHCARHHQACVSVRWVAAASRPSALHPLHAPVCAAQGLRPSPRPALPHSISIRPSPPAPAHGRCREKDDASTLAMLRAMPEVQEGRLKFFYADLLEEGTFDEAIQGCKWVLASVWVLASSKVALLASGPMGHCSWDGQLVGLWTGGW